MARFILIISRIFAALLCSFSGLNLCLLVNSAIKPGLSSLRLLVSRQQGIPGDLMQQLLVSRVTLLQPSTGCLHGMRCSPSLDPLVNWKDHTQAQGRAAHAIRILLFRCSTRRTGGSCQGSPAPFLSRSTSRASTSSTACVRGFPDHSWPSAVNLPSAQIPNGFAQEMNTCRTDMYTSDRTAGVMRPARS